MCVCVCVCYNCRDVLTLSAVFYPDTLGLGKIASIGGKMLGVWGCAPSGIQGQSPWSGGLVAKLEAFCCISSLFLSILKGIVEL